MQRYFQVLVVATLVAVVPERLKSLLRFCGLPILFFAVALLAACAPALDSNPPPLRRATPTPHVAVAIVGATATPTLSIPTLTPIPTLDSLGAGQHIDSGGSYQTGDTEAAGPMVCRIERDSPAFDQLINNYDSRVLWSGSEPAPYSDEDHKMHPAMAGPFDALVEAVEQEWDGDIKILVTEIYDSLGDHDPFNRDLNKKYALHFEGRSIDMIPWPFDKPNLARLCALAHNAGFDWVHNEADHCHASIKAQSLCELYDYRAGP